MASYKNTGPVDCTVDFDKSSIEGKVAIVTGGQCCKSRLNEAKATDYWNRCTRNRTGIRPSTDGGWV